MRSKFLRWNRRDFWKGFLTAMFTAGTTGVITILQSGTLPDLAAAKTIGIASIGAGLGYLVKNLVTNSDGEHFAGENAA